MAKANKLTARNIPAKGVSKRSANHVVGKLIGAKEGDNKVTTAIAAIELARSGGLPTGKMERMLAAYIAANPEEAAAHDASVAKPITGTRTAKKTDVAGPKAGSARANQHVAEPKSDVITSVKGTTSGGDYTVVMANNGQPAITIPRNRFLGEVAKLAVPGGSFKALADAWAKAKAAQPSAKLANGITGQNSPHSAKSVADQRAKDKPAPKAADKKVARKEAAKAKAAPKGDDTRKLTLLRKDFTFGAVGSARNDSWLVCAAVIKAKGTVADYIAKGGKAKYLPRWAAAGAIKLG